jgi:predicted amino acid-binding ACT domain protein
VTKNTAFLVQGQDRPGVIAGIVSKLADAGVNITALDAVAAGEGRYGAILWVKPAEVRKAAKALGAK